MSDSKVINSKADINTGMKMVELKGKVVDQLAPMTDTEKDYAIAQINKYFHNSGHPTKVMLMRKEDSYFTLFERSALKKLEAFAEDIVEFLMTDVHLITFGALKLVDEADGHLEIWLGDKFFALFAFDGFTVKL